MRRLDPTPMEVLPLPVRFRVTFLLQSLRDYHDGFIHTRVFGRSPYPGLRRFFATALHFYLDAYYCGSGTQGIPSVLEEIGLPSLANQLKALAETTIGSRTYREILRQSRNKIMAHPTFKLDDMKIGLDGLDLNNWDHVMLFSTVDRKLMRRTAALYRFLRRKYPLADALDDFASTVAR